MHRSLGKGRDAIAQAEAGFPTLHAHALLGLCGAFDCLIEDVVVARLVQEPTLLETTTFFGTLRLPLAALASPDSEARIRRIAQEAARVTDADLELGASRHERLLDLVSLGGFVPRRLRRALLVAAEVRSVFAHRGGVADERLVNTCRGLGYRVGEKVRLDAEMFTALMHGFQMYGLVIANRYIDLRGGTRMSYEWPGYEGVLAEVASRAIVPSQRAADSNV